MRIFFKKEIFNKPIAMHSNNNKVWIIKWKWINNSNSKTKIKVKWFKKKTWIFIIIMYLSLKQIIKFVKLQKRKKKEFNKMIH